MARRLPDPPDDDAPLSPGEARLDALLEQRFAPEQRRAFQRQLDAHDRDHADGKGQAQLDVRRWRRGLRFHGDVPEKVRALLSEWLPELTAHAGSSGLVLRDPYQEVSCYSRSAFEAEQGALPATLKLPASSYEYTPLYRRYTVRVVLPDSLTSMDVLFTVLRSVLTRLFGDVFLREEILPLEAYREDVEQEGSQVTVGLAEQMNVLSELPHSTPELEAAIGAYARNVGINIRRQAEQARKAWFAEAQQDLELQRLPAEREALVEAAFTGYLDELRLDPQRGVSVMVQAIEAQDRQLHFLPPDEAPDYARLREQNPLHFLRSVNLRLEFLIESLQGLAEDFDELSQGGIYPALAEERVAGCIAELERAQLARPYLVPGVRLSEELERKRTGFPMEVQGLMSRFPPEARGQQLHRTLSKRLESSLHQRLYNALVLMRHWMRLHDSGREGTFSSTEGYQTLKGLVANFRFRLPMLRSLFHRVGVVLDVAERQASPAGDAARRFPVDVFTRAWGQFAAHALLADYLVQVRRLKGFEAERYWSGVESRVLAQAQRGSESARLLYLLRRLLVLSGASDSLAKLVDELRQGSPAFRFAVQQSLRAGSDSHSPNDWRLQMDGWVRSVWQAREHRERNAITVGMTE